MRWLFVAFVAGCTVRVPLVLERPAEWSWHLDQARLPAGTLRVLHVATVKMNERQAVAGARSERLRAPIDVLLVEHPVQGLVLIDTAYGRRSAADLGDFPGNLQSRLLDIELDRPAADAIADLGYDPADVWHVVLTHGHTDHVGGIEDFPAAEVHVDEDEWTDALHQGRTKGYRSGPWEDREVLPVPWQDEPYGPFPRHADLFGDQSIVLLPAPGHTVGSLMVLVNLAGGSVLYTGDVAWVDENWQDPAPKGWIARRIIERDWREGMDPLWRIKEWVSRNPDLIVISGHEPENLERLPPWPQALIQ